jgi:FlaA1/EpsC-like NDP-sugar epimerase
LNFENKTILVTGGTGSIGRVLVKKCLQENVKEVVVLSRDEIKQFILQREAKDSRLRIFLADIRDTNALDRIFNLTKDIDIVFHAAAIKHVIVANENPVEATLTNVIGTQNVVDAAIKYEVPTSVLISTDKVVEPINVMGATKLISERIFLNAAKLSKKQVFSAVRFGNVANSRGSVIPAFVDDLLSKRELIVTDLEVHRFIMRIEDAVNLIIKESKLAVGGEIFVLKMKAFQLKDLVKVMIRKIAPRLGISAEKVKVNKIGLISGERLNEKLFFSDELDRVFDLGDFYVITDLKNFPRHKKYEGYPLTDHAQMSADKAQKISLKELEKIVMEYIKQKNLNAG